MRVKSISSSNSTANYFYLKTMNPNQVETVCSLWAMVPDTKLGFITHLPFAKQREQTVPKVQREQELEKGHGGG